MSCKDCAFIDCINRKYGHCCEYFCTADEYQTLAEIITTNKFVAK